MAKAVPKLNQEIQGHRLTKVITYNNHQIRAPSHCIWKIVEPQGRSREKTGKSRTFSVNSDQPATGTRKSDKKKQPVPVGVVNGTGQAEDERQIWFEVEVDERRNGERTDLRWTKETVVMEGRMVVGEGGGKRENGELSDGEQHLADLGTPAT